MQFSHYNASNVLQDQIQLHFDGTDFYVKGQKGGADAVSKKLADYSGLKAYNVNVDSYKINIANAYSIFYLTSITNYKTLEIGTNCVVFITQTDQVHSGVSKPTFTYTKSSGKLTINANNPSGTSGDCVYSKIKVYVLV